MTQDTSFDIGCFAGAVSRLGRLMDATTHINAELEELPDDINQDENDAAVGAIFKSVLGELSIPPNIYCDSYSGFSQSDTELLLRSMRKWSTGKMSRREVSDLLDDISENVDLDWCYVFAGIPLKELCPSQQQALLKPIVNFGTRSY